MKVPGAWRQTWEGLYSGSYLTLPVLPRLLYCFRFIYYQWLRSSDILMDTKDEPTLSGRTLRVRGPAKSLNAGVASVADLALAQGASVDASMGMDSV